MILNRKKTIAGMIKGGASPERSDAMAIPQSIIPTLQIINGPLSGQFFMLDRELTIIGRNLDCDLVLPPKSVSRKHAAIVRRKTGYEIKDVGSLRGTHVNGQKITQPVLLRDGDTIQLGDVLLTFTGKLLQIQQGDDEQSTVYATIEVMTQSDLNFPLVKPEAKLRALRLISQELGSTLLLNEILERIFNSLFEIFPRAERGFVLLKVPGSDRLSPELIRCRNGLETELKVSKTVLRRVLEGGQAILCKDLAQDLPESQSLSENKIRSLMCVPLLDQDRKPVGIMQIDTREGRGRFEQDDLDLLVAVAHQVSVAVQNAQLHKVLVEKKAFEQELRFAREVMQSLLPEQPAEIPGYESWAYYEPARHVGGDYYGFIPIKPSGSSTSRLAVAVGDVVGKGMPAALLTAKLSAEVQLALRDHDDPSMVVQQLNKHFDNGGALDMFITFLLVVIDVDRHRLTVVNAGHPCPFIRRRDGRLEEIGKGISGLPLGIAAESGYQIAETTIGPGEIVILYTDGVTDAMNSANDRFGEARLKHSILAAKPGATCVGEAVIRDVQAHVVDRAQFDDITLVCIARK
jgi:phosphoserine phosphatase RsbU/P